MQISSILHTDSITRNIQTFDRFLSSFTFFFLVIIVLNQSPEPIMRSIKPTSIYLKPAKGCHIKLIRYVTKSTSISKSAFVNIHAAEVTEIVRVM